MANTLVTFVVDDTSPCISYHPFSDTFGTPDLTAGWNPYFNISGFATAQGAVGSGTSQHITSLDGASLALQWRGSGIMLLGNVTQAAYNINIDGQETSLSTASPADNILLNIAGLPEALHNITLTAVILPPQGQAPPNSSMLVFDQAVVFSSPLLPNATNIGFQNSTLNDTDIAFSGLWSIEPPQTSDPTDRPPQFHISKTAGDRAFTQFNGTTFLLLGRTSPQAGNYTVTLDGNNSTSTMVETLSAKSSFTQDDSLLFFASDLDPTVLHSVQVVNQDGKELAMVIGGFKAFVPYNIRPAAPQPNSTQTTPSSGVSDTNTTFEKGTIAAFALAGILAFLLITGGLFFFVVYRPRRRRRRAPSALTFAQNKSPRKNIGPAAARRQSAKEQEANGQAPVLNIAPMFDDKNADLEADNAGTLTEPGPRRFSAISDGFQRWRRGAVRGSLGGTSLGIRFRHSDSPVASAAHDNAPYTGDEQRSRSQRSRSETSSWTESSGAARRRQEKRLGKMRQITGRSWSRSPSFKLNLGQGGSESHGYSQSESRRQSRRASRYPSASAAAAAVGAGVAGTVAGRVVSMDRVPAFSATDPAPIRPRALPIPHRYQNQPEPSKQSQPQLENTEEVAGPPTYAASISLSFSSPSNPSNSNSQSNPSSLVPRSVSRSPATTTYPRVHYRDSAKGFLLQDAEEGEGELTSSDVPDNGHSPPVHTAALRREHLSPPTTAEALVMRGEAANDMASAAETREMRDVIRSLSPRTSTTPARQLPIPPGQQRQYQQPGRWLPPSQRPLDIGAASGGLQSPEEESPDSATSPTRRPLLPVTNDTVERPFSRFVKKLPQTPTSDSEHYDEDGDGEAAFLNIPQASPFHVDFDRNRTSNGRSMRPLPSPNAPENGKATAGATSDNDSTEPDIYFTPSGNSSGARSSISNGGGIGTSGMPGQRNTSDSFQQGTSRLPFRLTPMSFPTSPAIPVISSPQSPSPADESPANSDGVTSFLDFTSSREGSLSARSGKKRGSRTLPLPPTVVEPKSRWSNTTVPSIATTNLGAGMSGHNDSSGESHLGEREEETGPRHLSTASSTFPIPVQVNIPPSPHHIMDHSSSSSGSRMGADGPPRSARTSGLTQQSDELHVHPVLEDIDSPTESIPMSVSDVQFRQSDSEGDPLDSRRTTGQNLFASHDAGHPALPNNATRTVEEYRPRPFDPSILVSRVLGLPSPASASTMRPGHTRTISAAAPSSASPSFPNSRSDLNSSNDRLNNVRQGPFS